jgi:hypothetical protein
MELAVLVDVLGNLIAWQFSLCVLKYPEIRHEYGTNNIANARR